MKTSPASAPSDSAWPQLLALLPQFARPYAVLARLDRPIGIWLLYLPCIMGVFLSRIGQGLTISELGLALLFLVGAVVMRGAGCTWNDIADRDIDAKVPRTAGRPLASGAVSLKAAYIFLGLQLALGFCVFLLLPWGAKGPALLSLPLVLLYPFMKRITWWPQAFLGLTFNCGVLVGAGSVGPIGVSAYIFYAGLIAWTLAYDTIYALQDREADALIGVKSTARLFGEKALLGIFVSHLIAIMLITYAMNLAGAPRLGALAGLAYFGHVLWQIAQLNPKAGGAVSGKLKAPMSGEDIESLETRALKVFRANAWVGLILVVALAMAALF